MPWIATLSPERQIEAGQLYQGGLSAQQVADQMGIGINAVFYTLRKLKIPRRSKKESNLIRFEAKSLSYTIKQSLTAREEQLKLAAVLLYWAEGYKVGKTGLDFANSDPDMALIFITFLRDICNVDESKIRCFIYAYDGQDVENLHRFWSTFLKVPRKSFTKPYIKHAVESKRGPRMLKGLVHVRYCDTKLLRQMLIWIDEYRAECVGGRVVKYTTL